MCQSTRPTLHTPHSTTLYTLHTPRSSLHTPHSPHSTLHTLRQQIHARTAPRSQTKTNYLPNKPSYSCIPFVTAMFHSHSASSASVSSASRSGAACSPQRSCSRHRAAEASDASWKEQDVIQQRSENKCQIKPATTCHDFILGFCNKKIGGFMGQSRCLRKHRSPMPATWKASSRFKATHFVAIPLCAARVDYRVAQDFRPECHEAPRLPHEMTFRIFKTSLFTLGSARRDWRVAKRNKPQTRLHPQTSYQENKNLTLHYAFGEKTILRGVYGWAVLSMWW